MKTILTRWAGVLAFAALLPLLLSCKKDKETTATATGAPEKGYATGKATDAAGKPLAGVKILIDNTLLYNTYISGVTDEKGFYKIKLNAGAWIPYAKVEKTYLGKQYSLYLDPDNVDGYGIDGGVCNFTWKLTGPKKGTLLGHYGGTVILTRGIGSQLYDSENIEYTFTPVGALIDGSTGTVLRLHEAAGTYKLADIPIGRYEVTARYNGKAVLLRNRYANGQFAAAIQVDFEPDSPDGNNMAAIDYKES